MTANPAQPAWMSEVRARVGVRLERFFALKRRESAPTDPAVLDLVDAVADLSTRGGKRLRPAILAAGLRAVAPQTELSRADDVGAALELLQSYLLIHDDWMDQDDERRGAPSVHARFRGRHGDPHLGGCLAILAGDLASAYAWELLACAPFDRAVLPGALATFGRVQEEVFFGQCMDVLGVGDVARMHELKTGSYTTRGPLRLGGLLGGASETQLAALDAFAAPLGVAFQLRDDLLGTFGSPGTLGKPVGSDLRKGKRTALIAAADTRLAASDKAVLAAVLGRTDADDEAVAKATSLLEACGARRAVEDRLEVLLAEAHAALRHPALAPEGVAWLTEVAEQMALRAH